MKTPFDVISEANSALSRSKWSLSVFRLPARLDAEQAATILGFNDHDISVLIAARLLKPLGNPSPNGPKHFATVQLQQFAQDPTWLHKATKVVADTWKVKNAKKKQVVAEPALTP
ncbi:MAG: hypothetical protein JWM68_4528 [Verrucomicrobiales bacterium]|nr:hypothetical protein [Verrucomicrobiales bacterium]